MLRPIEKQSNLRLLLIAGQIRFRNPILLGVIAIAGISLYEIVFSVKNRYRRNDSQLVVPDKVIFTEQYYMKKIL